MPAMTEQEIFDQVVIGLDWQGFKQAVNENEDCVYQDAEGKKCAIGHLLTPNEREKLPSSIDLVVRHGLLPERFAERFVFLSALQALHDDYGDTPYGMREAFFAYAKEHGLTWPASVQEPWSHDSGG